MRQRHLLLFTTRQMWVCLAVRAVQLQGDYIRSIGVYEYLLHEGRRIFLKTYPTQHFRTFILHPWCRQVSGTPTGWIQLRATNPQSQLLTPPGWWSKKASVRLIISLLILSY
jgi:hypothetical protein